MHPKHVYMSVILSFWKRRNRGVEKGIDGEGWEERRKIKNLDSGRGHARAGKVIRSHSYGHEVKGERDPQAI